MKDLVLRIVKELASLPDQVAVAESEENGSLVLTLTVAEEDKGKVIGKQGKVIKAIRSVVSAAAAKSNKKTIVEIP